MAKLLEQAQANLTFILVCGLIIAALAIAARIAEHFLPAKRKVTAARRIAIVSICAAIATVLHIFDFPLPFLAPEFYKLDFSEVPVMLCGFFLGPSATVACEAVKILLKLLLKGTSTAFVGDFANFAVGCSLVLPATIVYHIHKTKGSAIAGLALGTVVLTIFGSAFSNVPPFVALAVAPLNLIKGAVVSLLTLLLYKRVAKPLFCK